MCLPAHYRFSILFKLVPEAFVKHTLEWSAIITVSVGLIIDLLYCSMHSTGPTSQENRGDGGDGEGERAKGNG